MAYKQWTNCPKCTYIPFYPSTQLIHQSVFQKLSLLFNFAMNSFSTMNGAMAYINTNPQLWQNFGLALCDVCGRHGFCLDLVVFFLTENFNTSSWSLGVSDNLVKRSPRDIIISWADILWYFTANSLLSMYSINATLKLRVSWSLFSSFLSRGKLQLYGSTLLRQTQIWKVYF